MKPRFRKIGEYWVCIYYSDRFVFREEKLILMVRNYRAGCCPITVKGLKRYALIWGHRHARTTESIFGEQNAPLSALVYWEKMRVFKSYYIYSL